MPGRTIIEDSIDDLEAVSRNIDDVEYDRNDPQENIVYESYKYHMEASLRCLSVLQEIREKKNDALASTV